MDKEENKLEKSEQRQDSSGAEEQGGAHGPCHAEQALYLLKTFGPWAHKFIFYCCIANDQGLSGFKEPTDYVTVSVGQESTTFSPGSPLRVSPH